MKSYSCPGLSSGHFSRVCLSICSRVGENLVWLYHIFIPTKHNSLKIGKKTFSEREKMFNKNSAVFCILKNVRHWIIDFGSAVCPKIFILGIFYTKTFFPVAKVWIKSSFFWHFSCSYPLWSLWPKLKIEILYSFFKYNSC